MNSEPAASAAPTPPRAALLIVFLTVFIDLLGFGIVLPLLPLYGKQFTHDESGAVVGLLFASFSAMQFIFAPIWGQLSDRIGRRPVLLGGLLGSVVFYLLFALATVMESLPLLFAARIGAGIAGATLPAAQAFIADVTPLEKRAQGMAIVGAAFGLGFTFGPVLAWLALPDGDLKPGAGPGLAAAALSAVALVWGLWKLPESLRPENVSTGRHGRWNAAAFAEVLRTPSLTMLLLSFTLTTLAFAGFESTISLLLAEPAGGRKLDFHQICMTFAFIGLLSLIGQGFLVRRLAKVAPESVLAPIGAGLESAGFLWLALSAGSGSYTQILLAVGLVVIGFSFVNPTLSALISRRTDPKFQGGVLGLSQGLGSLARIVGPIVASMAFYKLHRTEYWTGAPYWMAAGLLLAAGLLILLAASSGKDFCAAATSDAAEGEASPPVH